mmetsp:Transcript_16057/g.45544  ORF Transcript_16057/g.45544 Transcript_16057/m.45544 type:complete len:217 (-) Transcript_16057:923-1573(-)
MACTSSGSRTAQPCTNLLNLCTGASAPDASTGRSHAGRSSASASASLSSSTAKGKRVRSLLGMLLAASRYHRPCSGAWSSSSRWTSLMRHRFVSMDARTAFVCASWKAVRWHCDRTVGTRRLVLTSRCTSRARRRSAAGRSAGGSYSARSRRGTSPGRTRKRSFTLASPVHASRCVFRSTKTSSGSPVPYHRSRSATAPGSFARRPWYSSREGESR